MALYVNKAISLILPVLPFFSTPVPARWLLVRPALGAHTL